MILHQLKVVLWKNLLIRKRHWLLTIIEAFMPITLFLLIVYGRSKIDGLSKINIETPTYFEPKLIDIDGIQVGLTDFLITPNDVRTKNVMHRVFVKFQIAGENVHYFNTTDDLIKFYYKNHNNTVIAIIFNQDDPMKFDYTIRCHEDASYSYDSFATSSLYHNIHQFNIEGESDYYRYGFLSLQAAMDISFMEEILGENLENLENSISLYSEAFPYPPHKEDPIRTLIIDVLPLLTIFSFIFLCPAVLKRVVEEKRAGTKELMKMVGMKSWMLWLGWFIYGMLPLPLSVGMIVILLKVPIFNAEESPIEYCHWTILFVFLVLYCMAAICICFAISSFFSKPTVAMITGILIWILSYIVPKNALDSNKNSWGISILMCLFPNMALHYGYAAIASYEEREIGSNWSNIYTSGSDGTNDVTLMNVFLMLIFDIILFTIFTVYMDEVNPGKYGVRKSYLFPLYNIRNMIIPEIDPKIAMETVNLANIEEGNELEKGIEVYDLYKTYKNKMAVNRLNLSIYKNEITVLLGHNGAGKTTTMSIITGMLEATSGSVKINGLNIKNNMDKIRQSMGLCPQHNLLFTDLTVREHLIFFAKLRGLASNDAEQEMNDLLEKMNLSDKKNSMANTLSGGMKRKLCLGMALIGGSKVLILDEPSSGLDPESRRELWDLLLQWRGDKTILITTHFMEEADALGDRIAIMNEGTLQCYGTPMYLKKSYNTGYHLTLTVDEDIKEADKEVIDAKIKTFLPNAEMHSQDGNSIVYVLPFDKNEEMTRMLSELEEFKSDLKIVCISITVTTLEDVFLKTRTEHDKGGTDDEQARDISALMDLKWAGSGAKTDIKVSLSALLVKRKQFTIRKSLSYFITVCVSLCFFVLTACLGTNSSNGSGSNGPALDLALSTYTSSYLVYYNVTESNSKSELIKAYYQQMVENAGSQASVVKDVHQNIIEKGIENIVYYKQHLIAGAQFKINGNKIEAISLYNAFARHSSPIALNLVTNVIAKALLGHQYSIKATNWPLETIDGNFSPQEYSYVEIYELWVFLTPLGSLFMMGCFIIFPFVELSTGFAKLQFMCGLHPILYWITNYLFDIIMYMIFMTIGAAILSIWMPLLRGWSQFGCLWIILFTYGLASIPLTYIFSRKKSLSGAFSLFIISMMFLGIVLTLIIELLAYSSGKDHKDMSEHWKKLFLSLIPQVGLTLIGERYAHRAVQNYNMDLPGKKSVLCYQDNPCCIRESTECAAERSFSPVLNDLSWMLISCFFYFILNLCFDLNTTKRIYSKMIYIINHMRYNYQQLNDDNISNIEPTEGNHTLRAKNLNKSFSDRPIVKNINFVLNSGQCLGILGVNGAGKTTTFRLLTKEEIPDQGSVEIKLNSKEIDMNTDEYLRELGYCPQADALNYVLTGRQILTVIAQLRNIDDVKLVNHYLKVFDLEQCADIPCGLYSGGNKRKLSLAISMIGYPPFVLLDEPTNGVDPSSRRKCWNIMKAIQKNQNSSFILTSHSMHECEALCNNLKIMKDGQFFKEGTISELKRDFGGFSIKFKLVNRRKSSGIDSVSRDECDSPQSLTGQSSYDQVDSFDSLDRLKDYLTKQFKGDIKDEHSGLLHLYLNQKDKKWSDIFKAVERLKLKNPHLIEDYVISEASLEDVFLSVAREVKEPSLKTSKNFWRRFKFK